MSVLSVCRACNAVTPVHVDVEGVERYDVHSVSARLDGLFDISALPMCTHTDEPTHRVTARCKHCKEWIVETTSGRNVNWHHGSGAQLGKGICALEPYGYQAEPEGAPCSKACRTRWANA